MTNPAHHQQQQKQEPAKASCKAMVGEQSERLFHIEVVNRKTRLRVRMTSYPMAESKCRTMASKITDYSWRRLELVPASISQS